MIYKLTLDFSLINLNMLIEEFAKNNIEVCFGEDCLYIIYIENPKMVPISNILRKNKIRNYFLKEITQPPTKTPTNYIQTWLLEKFNELEIIKFNEQNQELLKKAQENINKAKAEFTKLVEQYNQQNKEAQSNGGSNN